MKTTTNLGLKKIELTDSPPDITVQDFNWDKLDTEIKDIKDNKVAKETGKGLSANDYTTIEKDKLSGIAANANNYTHPANHPASIIAQDASNRFVTDAEKTAWNGKAAGAHTHTKAQISDFPASLPANGGNATTVGGFGVDVGVNNSYGLRPFATAQGDLTAGSTPMQNGWVYMVYE